MNLKKQHKQPFLIQSNKLIMSKYNLTLLEQKLIRILISLINKDDDIFKEYDLHVKDLQKLLKVKNLYSELPKVTEELLKKVIIIQDGENILQTTWLSSAYYRIGEGIVSIQFAPRLKPYLLDLKKEFTKYKLENILYLKSCYSIRIYELLKQYLNLKKRNMGLLELKEILGIENDKYKEYKHFKFRILLQAQKELKANTDLSFEFEEIKKGRQVVSLDFFIFDNENVFSETENEDKIDLDKPHHHDIDQLIQKLKEVIQEKISSKVFETILQNCNYDVKEVINYYNYAKENGNIENLAGFLIWATENKISLDEKIQIKNTKKSAIHNFPSRKYDFEELKKMELQLQLKEFKDIHK